MGADFDPVDSQSAQKNFPAEIYPAEMEALLSSGAALFDVSEDAAGNGEPTRLSAMHPEHVPLSRLGELERKINREKPVIFCCRSGLLSYQAAKIAANWTKQPVYYLPGGLLSVSDG
jgi:rhodanese-related sulfurtransferase